MFEDLTKAQMEVMHDLNIKIMKLFCEMEVACEKEGNNFDGSMTLLTVLLFNILKTHGILTPTNEYLGFVFAKLRDDILIMHESGNTSIKFMDVHTKCEIKGINETVN